MYYPQPVFIKMVKIRHMFRTNKLQSQKPYMRTRQDNTHTLTQINNAQGQLSGTSKDTGHSISARQPGALTRSQRPCRPSRRTHSPKSHCFHNFYNNKIQAGKDKGRKGEREDPHWSQRGGSFSLRLPLQVSLSHRCTQQD